MPFFATAPRRNLNRGNLYSVKDIQDEITQFNLMYEVGKNGSVNNCNNVDKALYWRQYVRESAINAGSTPVELDFFEKIAGGKTELIPAKEMTFRQNADYDRNIYAKSSATGLVPGGEAIFTLLRSNHSVSGTESYAAIGYEIFQYEDQQWLRVMDVDRSNPFAHRIKVKPKNKLYTVNIRGGRKMLVSPATQVGGYTCNNDFAGEHRTPGYMYRMTMLRLRVQWKQAVDLMKGYTDVLQFGIMFDNEGKEIDCWEYYKKIKAQENLKYAFNLAMFLGQKLDNPDIFVDSMNGDETYPGFDGYSQQVQNGGGIVYPYDTQYGIDPQSDMASILLRQDSMKRYKEYVILRALPFEMKFDTNFSKVLKQAQGCSYDTFKMTPGGNNQNEVVRMGIKSVAMWNLTLHFKDFDALSDSRSIGNSDMPYWAFMMPTTGIRDSNGRTVPPIEFFTNKGCAGDGQYEEHTYDARREKSGCEEIGGWMSKTIGMVIHGLQDHVIFRPRKKC